MWNRQDNLPQHHLKLQTHKSQILAPHIPLRVTTTLRAVGWSRCSHSHIPWTRTVNIRRELLSILYCNVRDKMCGGQCTLLQPQITSYSLTLESLVNKISQFQAISFLIERKGKDISIPKKRCSLLHAFKTFQNINLMYWFSTTFYSQ
jgi:hypothetical protein